MAALVTLYLGMLTLDWQVILDKVPYVSGREETLLDAAFFDLISFFLPPPPSLYFVVGRFSLFSSFDRNLVKYCPFPFLPLSDCLLPLHPSITPQVGHIMICRPS